MCSSDLVAAVMDRLAIDQLVAGDYPRALDARDWDAYVATFTDDGELVLGENRSKGAAASEALWADRYEQSARAGSVTQLATLTRMFAEASSGESCASGASTGIGAARDCTLVRWTTVGWLSPGSRIAVACVKPAPSMIQVSTVVADDMSACPASTGRDRVKIRPPPSTSAMSNVAPGPTSVAAGP